MMCTYSVLNAISTCYMIVADSSLRSKTSATKMRTGSHSFGDEPGSLRTKKGGTHKKILVSPHAHQPKCAPKNYGETPEDSPKGRYLKT